MTMISLLACLSLAMAPTSEPPVGFIWHYPFVDVGTEHVAGTGVTAMIARAPWGLVQPEEGRFDFSALEKQIAEAEKGGFRLTLLLECNPFCTPPWLLQKVRQAGELVGDVDGVPGPVPRTTSPVFCRAQEEFLRRVIEKVKAMDRRRVVTHYQAGVEWWFPYSFRHAPADLARFRAWLKRQYRSLEGLNAAWKSAFPTLDAVSPPPLTVSDLWLRKRQGLTPLQLAGPEPTGIGNLDAASADWFRFWYETAGDYINRLARLVKQRDPSRRTATFLTMSFAFTAEWDYTQWAAVSLDEVARRARDVDDLGMQLCMAEGDLYRITAGLDVARKYGKPMFVLDLLDFAAGVAIGYDRMEKATHAAIQHGASGLFYCCWNGAKDFNFYPDWPLEDLRRMLGEARRALRLMQGWKIEAEGALVEPILPASPNDRSGSKNDVGSFLGWYKLLEGARRIFDVVTPREIESGQADPARYRWVLVPDSAVLPRRVVHRLADYVRQGGCLLTSGRYAERDPAGNSLETPSGARLPDFGKAYAGPLVRDGHAGDTPPLILWREETAAYAGIRTQAEAALDARFREAGIRPEAEVAPAIPTVTAMRSRSGSRRCIYLVNTAQRAAEGLRLRVRGSTKAAPELFADLERVQPACHASGEWLEIELPAFRTSCIVRWRRAGSR